MSDKIKPRQHRLPKKISPLRNDNRKRIIPSSISEDEKLEPAFNFGRRLEEEWR